MTDQNNNNFLDDFLNDDTTKTIKATTDNFKVDFAELDNPLPKEEKKTEQTNLPTIFPEGLYIAEISAVVKKTARSGNEYLLICFRPTKPVAERSNDNLVKPMTMVQFSKDSVIFDNFNIFHPNPKAKHVSLERLKRVFRATGTDTNSDVQTLKQKQLMIQVKIETGYKGITQNKIQEYFRVGEFTETIY